MPTVLGFGSYASVARQCVRSLRVLCLLTAVLSSRGQAQAASADKVMAEAMFDRGLTLMRQGKVEQACAQLEQSQSIERGIGTMLYLAECYEKLGKTASAWAMFREAASAARAENQADRARAGSARAEKLEPLLSRLTIHAPNAASTEGLSVRRNGQVVPPGAYGVALPSDPGPQRLDASAPGRLTWSITVTLAANGSTLNVDVPELAVDPTPAPSAQPMAAIQAPASEAPTQPASAPAAAFKTESEHSASWQRPLGLALGGAGVVAIGVGAFFGARAIGKNSDLEDACPAVACASSNEHLQSSADTAATLSTAFFIGGAGLLGAGAVIFFTAPNDRLDVSVQAHGNGAQLRFKGAL